MNELEAKLKSLWNVGINLGMSTVVVIMSAFFFILNGRWTWIIIGSINIGVIISCINLKKQLILEIKNENADEI